jgi:hypothetical protein
MKPRKSIFARILDFLIACHPFVAPLITPNDEYDPRDYAE